MAIGAGSATGTVLLLALYKRTDPPDLLLTTLAVGSLVCFLLAVIGRLPSGFQVAGMTFDFPEDQLADLLGTVKSSLEDDPKTRARILELIKEGTGRESYQAAERRLEGPATLRDEAAAPERPADAKSSAASAETDDADVDVEDQIYRLLSTLASGGEVQKRYEIARSGKGKPPIFDYYFERDGAGVAVQMERYWNPSTVDLISRKTDRALRKTTSVNVVVIIVPKGGVEAFTEAIEPPNVLVVQRHELEDLHFGARLDDVMTNYS